MGTFPSFFLAVALVALGFGWGVSVLSLGLLPALRSRAAALRADVAALAEALPAIAALAAGAAVALPSLRYAAGVGDDHCVEHLHHLHLCWAHAHPLPWAIALPLSVVFLSAPLRIGLVVIRLRRLSRVAARLVRLGERGAEPGIVWLPGARVICHTVGLGSPIILLSRSLSATLSPGELEAVIQHERAHAARRDPAWGALLALCAAFSAPGVARRWAQIRAAAAEQVADDAAAARAGADVVAAALLKVARLQIAPLPAPSFGVEGLEGRVCRLLDGPEAPRAARASSWLCLLAALAAATVAIGHEPFHHLIEAAVSLLIR